ncbi:MAG: sensor histidine kinase, partial [Deltaproteobacteria bacterium]|nr:sensor histidine kinase [Deltaproteobacteria bacterium]
EESSENLTPEATELILEIINQTDRAGEIVKNLLDFSRNDKPLFGELRVDEVISKTITLLKNQIMLMGIEKEINLPKDLPRIIR